MRTIALALVGACVALWMSGLSAGRLAGPNPIVRENALVGSAGWRVAQPSSPREIEGYASQVSVVAGDELELHVSTLPAARYRVEVFRLGWYGGAGGRLVACSPGCAADEQGLARPVPAPDAATGYLAAGWPVTDRLAVGESWVSGYYLAVLRLTAGAEAGRGAWVPFVVRATGARSAFLVQAAVNTWQAYNRWGGRSLYRDETGASCRARCSSVSFDRPYDPTTQNLWAYELPLVHFLEENGYDVSYTTDVDTDRDPAELLRHRSVIVAGHDEYWTRTMRDALEQSRDRGTNLAFMGANTGYWQMRYEAGRRTIVEYRTSAADPVRDPASKTVRFRSLRPPRPECELLGVQYQGKPVESIGGPFDYTVTATAVADPWLAGTGFAAGDVLRGIVGYEWDRVEPGCRTPPLTRLFQYRGPPADADAVRYTARSGARVFSAGTLSFAQALDDFVYHVDEAPHGDARLERFVRNVLADLGRPAPARRVRVRVRGGRVLVLFGRGPDPRVTGARIYRGRATAPFRGRLICVTRRDRCVDRTPPSGEAVRYAVVLRDRWDDSVPVFSAPVRP